MVYSFYVELITKIVHTDKYITNSSWHVDLQYGMILNVTSDFKISGFFIWKESV